MTTRTLLLSVTLSSILLACGGAPPVDDAPEASPALATPRPDALMAYTLLVDPSLSPDQTVDLLDAAMDWTRATGVTFDIGVGQCDFDRTADDTICVDAVLPSELPPELIGATYHSTTGHASIVRLDKTSPLLPWAARHELGHALGLSHTGVGTLMHWETIGASRTITPTDVGQFLELRGRSHVVADLATSLDSREIP